MENLLHPIILDGDIDSVIATAKANDKPCLTDVDRTDVSTINKLLSAGWHLVIDAEKYLKGMYSFIIIPAPKKGEVL